MLCYLLWHTPGVKLSVGRIAAPKKSVLPISIPNIFLISIPLLRRISLQSERSTVFFDSEFGSVIFISSCRENSRRLNVEPEIFPLCCSYPVLSDHFFTSEKPPC